MGDLITLILPCLALSPFPLRLLPSWPCPLRRGMGLGVRYLCATGNDAGD